MSSTAKLMSGKNYTKKVRKLQETHLENDACFVCSQPNARLVCSDFNIFVCQFCADIHTEFGHNIRSVLHSEWDAEGYAALKSGGNKAAASQWLAFWKQEDFARPAHKDTPRIKDFIRKAFVVKCWQKQPKRPPRKATVMSTRPTEQAKASLDDDVQPWPGATFEVDWANLQPPEETAPPQACTPSPQLYCSAHEAPENRPKTGPKDAECQGCHMTFMTNHRSLAYCPNCASSLHRCLICGEGLSAPATCKSVAGTPEAVFCGKHDQSCKREKIPNIHEQLCLSCGVAMMTTYLSMAHCPPCSSKLRACLICGDVQAGCVSREGSESHPSNQSNKSTEAPPTAQGLDPPPALDEEAEAEAEAEGEAEAERQSKPLESASDVTADSQRKSEADAGAWEAHFEDSAVSAASPNAGGQKAAGDLLDLLDVCTPAPQVASAPTPAITKPTFAPAPAPFPTRGISDEEVRSTGSSGIDMPPVPSEKEGTAVASPASGAAMAFRLRPPPASTSPLPGTTKSERALPPPASPGDKEDLLGDVEEDEVSVPPPRPLSRTEGSAVASGILSSEKGKDKSVAPSVPKPTVAAADASSSQPEDPFAELLGMRTVNGGNPNGGNSSSSSSFVPQDPFADLFSGGLFQKGTQVAPAAASQPGAPTLLQSKPTANFAPAAGCWSSAAPMTTAAVAPAATATVASAPGNIGSSTGSASHTASFAVKTTTEPKTQEVASSSFMPDDWLLEADAASAKKADVFGDVMDVFHKVEKHFGEVKNHAGQAGVGTTTQMPASKGLDIIGDFIVESQC